MKIAVFGLGSMGYGMAQSLQRAGHEAYGFDINADAVTRFVAEGGAKAEIETIGADLDAVVLVVVNAAQTEGLLFGDDGIARHLSAETVVMACATVAPEFARDMATRCEALKLWYLDSPISGGAAKAATGDLSIMLSGAQNGLDKVQPLLDAVAAKVFDLGREPGAGSAMKAVNQMLAGIHIAAMAEALTFGIAQGITPETFIDVISQCAGTSWMLENRAPHIADGDYTPRSAIDIWPKDLGIVSAMAEDKNFDAPLTRAALAQFSAASQAGRGGMDDAAVAYVYAEQAGLELPADKNG